MSSGCFSITIVIRFPGPWSVPLMWTINLTVLFDEMSVALSLDTFQWCRPPFSKIPAFQCAISLEDFYFSV